MTSHKDYRLDQLGIPSQYEADELERDLNVRFELFTYNDREVWVQQNVYLDAYAYNRTVSESADMAGVPISIAQNWKYFNTLGFKRRLEIADLRFSDSLQVLALERVREPDAPASLLITLLRAHIPEKFSTNGHVCDTSKADELLSLYSQDAQRELEAGHPGLRAIADGTYQPPARSRSHDDPSYTNPPSADAGFKPAYDPSAPSAVNPPTPSVRPEPVEGQFPSPTADAASNPAHDPYAPSTPNPLTPPFALSLSKGNSPHPPQAQLPILPTTPPHPPRRIPLTPPFALSLSKGKSPHPPVIPAKERHPVPRYGAGIHTLRRISTKLSHTTLSHDGRGDKRTHRRGRGGRRGERESIAGGFSPSPPYRVRGKL